jgi:hypothetical protein
MSTRLEADLIALLRAFREVMSKLRTVETTARARLAETDEDSVDGIEARLMLKAFGGWAIASTR